MQIDKFKGVLSHKHKVKTEDIPTVSVNSLPSIPVISTGAGSGVLYGFLYNHFAVTDQRKLYAAGWAIPSPENFNTLINFVGGNPGNVLKESGTLHWNEGNQGLNTVKFNLIGAGHRNPNGNYGSLKGLTALWTSETIQAGVYATGFDCLFNQGVFYPFSYYSPFFGNSVRLVKTATALTNGQTGSYTGNDGQVYPTICIGTQEFLSVNLAETKYRNGDLISLITDNSAWAAATGGRCAYDNNLSNVQENTQIPIIDIINQSVSTSEQVTSLVTPAMGYLYNSLAGNDVRNIAANGWQVPSEAQYQTAFDFLGGNSVAGQKLKSSSIWGWNSPNLFSDNASLFSAHGSGYRNLDGVFVQLKQSANFFTRTMDGVNYRVLCLTVNYPSVFFSSFSAKTGTSIRLIKTATALTNGQTGSYTGNDGQVYPTICIGTQEFLSVNLAETKYRNGDLISNITDNSAWAAATGGGRCAYNNNQLIAENGIIQELQSDVLTLQTQVKLLVNFLDLTPFVYNVPEPMILTSMVCESSAATLSAPLNTPFVQFAKLTITPTSIGLVILKGKTL